MMNERNFRTLDLNLLRVFDEVMTERNLTRAAHNLAMTQPAVSNALKRLREAMGDELVRRSGYGVEPTPVAMLLWPTVRDALHMLNNLTCITCHDIHAERDKVLFPEEQAQVFMLKPWRRDSSFGGASMRLVS